MIGSMYDFTAGRAKRPLLKDPRRRFLLFLLLVVIVIQLSSLVALITVLLVNLCLVRISGLPWKYVGWRLLLIVPFGLGAVVLLPFSIPGEPLWTLWRFVLSEEGMSKGLLILFKLINANLLVTLLLASTPLDVLLRTLKQVKIPPVMVELMGFMLRYLVRFDGRSAKNAGFTKSEGAEDERIFALANVQADRPVARSVVHPQFPEKRTDPCRDVVKRNGLVEGGSPR